MNKQPYMGWKDCKLHLFHAKQATPTQREALAPFEGIDINKPGGGTKTLDALLTARDVGVKTQSTHQP